MFMETLLELSALKNSDLLIFLLDSVIVNAQTAKKTNNLRSDSIIFRNEENESVIVNAQTARKTNNLRSHFIMFTNELVKCCSFEISD